VIDHLLQTIPPLAVYLLVGFVIGIESLGIPMPGEIVLVAAALLSSHHELAVSPVWIAVAGIIGAITGDSIGFLIGHRYGRRLFDWLGRKFPQHFGPSHLAFAERIFTKYGVFAVFFGRFVAILRTFAGPLAGTLKMPYGKFLAANALGGICWAGGTTAAIYYLGVVAEKVLSQFAWVGLAAAVVAGVVIAIVIKRKTNKMVEASTGDNEITASGTDFTEAETPQAKAERSAN
jgi:membrane protein DedA with SNARE-associated domain